MERGDTGDTYSQHTLAWVLLTGTQDLDHPTPGASSEDCVDTLSWVSWGSHEAMDNFPLITGPMHSGPNQGFLSNGYIIKYGTEC